LSPVAGVDVVESDVAEAEVAEAEVGAVADGAADVDAADAGVAAGTADDVAGAACFLPNGSHDAKLLDFFTGAGAGGACALCCAALCGDTSPAWQPTP